MFVFNNDTEVIDSQWLKKMVSYAINPQIGAVGCKLLFPDMTVQHGRVVAESMELPDMHTIFIC